jgi:hypothetical protein
MYSSSKKANSAFLAVRRRTSLTCLNFCLMLVVEASLLRVKPACRHKMLVNSDTGVRRCKMIYYLPATHTKKPLTSRLTSFNRTSFSQKANTEGTCADASRSDTQDLLQRSLTFDDPMPVSHLLRVKASWVCERLAKQVGLHRPRVPFPCRCYLRCRLS